GPMDLNALRSAVQNLIQNKTLSLSPESFDSVDLQALIARYFPAGALLLENAALAPIDNGISVSGTTSVLPMTNIVLTLQFTLLAKKVYASLTVSLSIPDPVSQLSLSLSTSGDLSGSLRIVDTDVTLSGKAVAPVTVTGTITNLAVTRLAQSLLGAIVPAEIPDIEFETVAVEVTPQSGAFSLSAQAKGQWDNGNFAIDQAALAISRTAGEGLSFE